MEPIKKKKKKKLNLILPIVVALIIVLGLWLCNYVTLFNLGDTERGTFGDMFGSVNAIFSGLAFAGIIITIYIQSHELKLQRKELKLTRQEAKRTRGELNKQNETLTKQQFENTFFQMLSLFHESIEKIHTSIESFTLNGKAVFSVVKNEINENIDTILRQRVSAVGPTTMSFQDLMYAEKRKIEILDYLDAYRSVYYKYDNVLTPYYSTLINILKFLDQSYIDDKNFYVSIISSQFSRDECLVLFIHTHVSPQCTMERDLIEKYNVVDGLNRDMLVKGSLFTDYLEQKKA